MTRQFLAALALGSALIGGTAAAASAPMARERGMIDSVSGNTLELTTRSGEHLRLKLAEGVQVTAAIHAQIADIKPDSYIGTAAVPLPDGTLKALEVHVFDPSLRGAGDGHRPWDLGGSSTMTNGEVGSLVGTSGRTMTVQYHGGAKQVVVPPDVPIVALAPADQSIIKPGAHVLAFARQADDGTLTIDRMVVGKDGTVPPM